jgi:DNA modification methylase
MELKPVTDAPLFASLKKPLPYTLIHSDCVEAMRKMPDASVDAVVCDPPYFIAFMSKKWDNAESGEAQEELHRAWCVEALRVLKPGGHLLAFGGTRTYHRLAGAVEDAGFEIRDSLIWCYGSGFPKSLDVSKAMDKRGGQSVAWFGPWLKEERERRGISRKDLAQHFPSAQPYAGKEASGKPTGCVGNWETGYSLPTPEQFNKLCEVLELPFARMEEAEREVLQKRTMIQGGGTAYNLREGERREVEANITAPATDAAKTWEGWGTALKPAFEPVVVGRKPLAGTVAENVLKHGTGALNIAATRIPFASAADEKESKDKNQHADFGTPPLTGNTTYGDYSMVQPKNYNPPGRWPSNLLLAHSPSCVHLDTEGDTDLWACVPGCPIRALDAQSGTSKSSGGAGEKSRGGMGKRVFGEYTLDRNGENAGGLGDVGGASRYFMRFDPNDAPFIYQAKANTKDRNAGIESRNTHPTVKSTSLMQYLCRLVTPPGGVVLDPFMGSGSTGVACMKEGFRFIGIEREQEYFDIAQQRIEHAAKSDS